MESELKRYGISPTFEESEWQLSILYQCPSGNVSTAQWEDMSSDPGSSVYASVSEDSYLSSSKEMEFLI